MTSSHSLLADLQKRGVKVVAEGQQLRCRGPRGALTPADLDELRTHKSEILAELRRGAPDYYTLAGRERDWAAAWTRAQQGFAAHGIEPTTETLTGAATLELWISDGGPPRPGMTVEDLKDWCREIYSGRGSARVDQDGRVVLRALPDPSGEAS